MISISPNRPRPVTADQRGLASFIVVFILMIVLSLILFGFAKIVRREQQQVLDRTLNNRAYYAAESGINVVISKMETGGISDKTNCDAGNGIAAADLQIDPNPANKTTVSCLTVDTTPTELVYSAVSANTALVAPFTASGVVSQINFEWENPAVGSSASYPCASFTTPPAASWNCGAAMLRVDVVPITNAKNRQGWIDSMFSVFMYPTAGGSGMVGYATGNAGKGVTAAASCAVDATAPDCHVTVQGLGALNTQQYSLRIMSLYQPAALVVRPTDAAGASLQLSGAQVVIDSTGRAQDVVKRIRVRKAINSYIVPNFTVQTASSLCKRMNVVGTTAVAAAFTAVATPLPAGIDNPCIGWN